MTEEEGPMYTTIDANVQTQSSTINNLVEALVKAQADLQPAKKDSENPFFRSRYADLASVWDACREPLTKHGLAVIQTLGGSSDNVAVITTLAHVSGEWIRGQVMLKPVKNDPQAIGSCITYGRRYGLAAVVGVIQEDDDANTASGREDGAKGQKMPEPAKLSEPTKILKQPATKSALKPGKVAPLKTWEQVTDELHTELGDEAYFEILGEHGVTKASEISNKAEQASCWHELKAKLAEMQGGQ